MKSEKRMVGDYTVLCAVNIGSREIILAENEQDKNGERFLCCYGENDACKLRVHHYAQSGVHRPH